MASIAANIQLNTWEDVFDYLDDIFKMKNETAWEYPVGKPSDQCSISLEKRMLEFKGQCKHMSPTIRSKRPLNGAAGVVIESEIKKDWKCANHHSYKVLFSVY